MKSKKFIEDWKNLEKDKRLFVFITVILCITILVQGILLIYSVSSERTVIVPSYIDRKFYIEGSKASPEYIEMMSKYSVDLLNAYTPETIEERVREFMRFISPEHYKTISTELLAFAEEQKTYRISQFFIVQRITLKDNVVTIRGQYRRYSQDKQTAAGPIEIKITFKINDGRFEIAKYDKDENPI